MEMTVVLDSWVSVGLSSHEMLHLQCANAEHQYDLNLLFHAHRQAQEFWYRDCDDHEIKGYVDPGMRPGEDVEVDALSFVFTIPALPNVRDRCTVEDTGQCEGQPVRNRYSGKCVACDAKLFAWKDAKTKAQE
jgi:hypothetical protein